MYKFKKSLFALAGLLTLIGVIALFTPQTIRSQTESAGPTTPVLVVNSPSEPGTVNVGNQGDSPLSVRDVDNPARQPVQFDGSCSGLDPNCFKIFTVPGRKRLVIEYASIAASTLVVGPAPAPAGQVARLRITTSVGGETSIHNLPLTLPSVSFGLSNIATVGQQVRLYADPGTDVIALAGRSGSGAGNLNFAISGHLVDVQ